MPAESKKLDTKCPETFGGKSGGGVLLQLIVQLHAVFYGTYDFLLVIGRVPESQVIGLQNSSMVPWVERNLNKNFFSNFPMILFNDFSKIAYAFPWIN